MPYEYYDDPGFSYPSFWEDREYEHEAEVVAIQRLLGVSRFACAADIGGGFGRLAELLAQYASKVMLIEPSVVQRKMAHSFISHRVTVQDGNAEETGLQTKSCDLVAMVRVMHHLPHPEKSIGEIWRILKPNGQLLLEFANSNNFKARARNLFRPLPQTSIDMSTSADKVPFVNHHPAAIMRMMQDEGFSVITVLSVSNFRSPLLKKMVPPELLLWLEQHSQKLLAWLYFGPSIFILAKKPDKSKLPIREATLPYVRFLRS